MPEAWPDDRRHRVHPDDVAEDHPAGGGFSERRFIAIGQTEDGRLAFVIFTSREREGRVLPRPISARYMHEKEVRKYGQALARLQDR